MKNEVNSYSMNLFMLNELQKEHGVSEEDRRRTLSASIGRYNNNFTGPGYYYMWPFGVKERLEENADKILSGEILKDHEVYQEALDALKESKS